MSLSTIDTRQMVTYPGAVLQVVQGVNTTTLTINPAASPTATFYDVGTQASITPLYTTSKILVMVQQSYHHDSSGAQGTGFRINRNGSDVTLNSGYSSSYTNANRVHGFSNIVFLDSPASTSPQLYKVRAAHWTTSGNIVYQYGGTDCPSTITLMEIAG